MNRKLGLYGALGTLGQRRSPVTADPLWRSLPTACAPWVCGPLSSREESSRQRPWATVSGVQPSRQEGMPHALPWTAGWTTEIPRARGRMSFSTIRGHC